MPAGLLEVVATLVALGCWAVCALLVRSNRHRVPVVGRVLRRSRVGWPPRLDVSYPAPGPDDDPEDQQDGELRARLMAGFALADTGQPVTVYVNPADPSDVSLGPGGPAHVWAVVLGVAGLMAAAFAIRVLTL